MFHSANENNTPIPAAPLEPDAHGQAALMLAESILHALMEGGTFTVAQALSVVATAQEIKREFAQLEGESKGRMQASLDILNTIAGSLEKELP
ncbi:MAG: hypothetical protein M3R64_06925 [Pseudomonadota bacterium]|nr:hypothetical protein [Pseudomonadota bacterium]